MNQEIGCAITKKKTNYCAEREKRGALPHGMLVHSGTDEGITSSFKRRRKD